MNHRINKILAVGLALAMCTGPALAQELIQYGSAVTYNDKTARTAFPQAWGQYGNGQRHNPAYTVPANAPAFLTNGVLSVAPTTGDEYRRVQAARNYFPQDGNLAFGSTAGQWVGNVVGVAVAQGIVFVATSRREIYALDANTSLAIWRKELIGVGGMSQPLVQVIGGRLRVIITSGDADYNADNAVRAAYNQPHDRGAEYSAVYCLDALTGSQVWRYDTQGSARPTPLYRNGNLYVVNGDGNLYILNATTGVLISKFANPGDGQVGLASPNWYLTAAGRLLIYYGTTSPRNLLAVDVTSSTAPTLAWSYAPPGATSNAPGDVAMAVDPDAGLLVSSVFTNVGTSNAPIYDQRILALNATTGALVWSVFGGQGPTLDGFKSGNPMIDQGAVYLGNPLNATIQSYNLLTGALRWSLPVTDSDPSVRLAPRAAPVLAQGKLIFPVGQHIFSIDPATGSKINDYYSPYPYAAYGLNQPVVVGNQVYLSSVSGWVHYLPLNTLLTQPQPPVETVPTLPLKTAEYYDSSAQPTSSQTVAFPTQWLSYAANAAHTGYSATGPTLGARWSAALPNALSLSGTPQGDALYGSEVATQMTHLNVGVGSAVSPAAGRLFVAGNNRTVNAYNATTGKLIWRFRTNNHNMGQPLVTPSAVLVSGGNLGLNLGNQGSFIKLSPQTRLGTGFMYIHALDPASGNEKWTFYAGQGTLSTTPLYRNGNLYWVDGQSKVWAINADSGQPVAPFMDTAGQPVLNLGGGFNALSSANVYQDSLGRALMIVGLAMPNRIVAVDLATAMIAWTQDLIGSPSHLTGFASSSPAVDQSSGLIVGSVIVDADLVTNNARVLVYALDGNNGNAVWTQRLDGGTVPSGFVAPTPMLANNRVHIANPLARQVQALALSSGTSLWKTSLNSSVARHAWGPAALLGSGKLLQPAGNALYTLDTATGALLKTYTPGGAFTYNSATVLGKSVYIGNSYGWVLGLKFSDVGG